MLYFNPQGPRGPRHYGPLKIALPQPISIHKALAGLDVGLFLDVVNQLISIHKALAGLDDWRNGMKQQRLYFNPQGPRGPRRETAMYDLYDEGISIHKALAGLDQQLFIKTL